MTALGNGLYGAKHYEDAISVYEAELAMKRRLGAPERRILDVQNNLANTYYSLGRLEEASQMDRDIYCGRLKLLGEEHYDTLRAAINYASSHVFLQHFKEVKSLLRKTMPVARRVLGDSHEITLRMRWVYAETFYKADAATLDDLREAVNTLEETERTARRVLGSAHPDAAVFEKSLQNARLALRARETWGDA